MISDVVQITGTLTDTGGIQADVIAVGGIDGNLSTAASISAQMAPVEVLTGNMSDVVSISADITIPEIAGTSYYDGDYEITPGEVPQVLATDKLTMRRNVTINAIPSNYGRIDWDGTRLMVY